MRDLKETFVKWTMKYHEEAPVFAGIAKFCDNFGPLIGITRGQEREINDGDLDFFFFKK